MNKPTLHKEANFQIIIREQILIRTIYLQYISENNLKYLEDQKRNNLWFYFFKELFSVNTGAK